MAGTALGGGGAQWDAWRDGSGFCPGCSGASGVVMTCHRTHATHGGWSLHSLPPSCLNPELLSRSRLRLMFHRSQRHQGKSGLGFLSSPLQAAGSTGEKEEVKTKRADGKAHAALHLEPRHSLMLTSCSRSRGTAQAANVGPAQLPRALAHAPGISPGKACGQARADLRDAGRSSSGD